jgi:hypothetical protein
MADGRWLLLLLLLLLRGHQPLNVLLARSMQLLLLSLRLMWLPLSVGLSSAVHVGDCRSCSRQFRLKHNRGLRRVLPICGDAPLQELRPPDGGAVAPFVQHKMFRQLEANVATSANPLVVPYDWQQRPRREQPWRVLQLRLGRVPRHLGRLGLLLLLLLLLLL